MPSHVKPTPVIESPGPPNPHDPSGNTTDLLIGGNLLQWSPLQLTNYNMELEGTGTVELIGPSSLVNSSLTLTGPNANLVNDGTMRLQHSQLSIDGSLAGYGAVVATHGSTITAASSVPSQIPYPFAANKPDATVTAKSTYPSETIILQSSTLNVGPGGPWGARVVMDAGSTVNIESGATVHGNIQDQGGQIIDSGSVSGGNIGITNGTLLFPQIGFVHGPELESLNFTSTLSFGGKSDAVEFQGGAAGLMINVNIPLKEVAVFSLGEKIADFHLGPGAYSAANFSVKGDQLLYHHS